MRNTSARRRPVSTSVRMMARSRRPGGVSGITANSRRTSSAESPRAGGVEVRGRSSRSQGLLWHDVHADEEAVEGGEASHAGADGHRRGVLAGETFAVRPEEDFLGGHFVRSFRHSAEEVLEHAGVALDGAAGSGPAFLLHEEGDTSLAPSR